MTTTALRIGTDGSVEPVELPDSHDAQRRALRELLGGTADAAAYHHRALLHVHGAGAQMLELNTAAWALASAWRGLNITYGLYGTVIVTGPTDDEGCATPLAADLAGQARNACTAVQDVLGEWRSRPPEGEDAAQAALLAAARRHVTNSVRC